MRLFAASAMGLVVTISSPESSDGVRRENARVGDPPKVGGPVGRGALPADRAETGQGAGRIRAVARRGEQTQRLEHQDSRTHEKRTVPRERACKSRRRRRSGKHAVGDNGLCERRAGAERWPGARPPSLQGSRRSLRRRKKAPKCIKHGARHDVSKRTSWPTMSPEVFLATGGSCGGVVTAPAAPADRTGQQRAKTRARSQAQGRDCAAARRGRGCRSARTIAEIPYSSKIAGILNQRTEFLRMQNQRRLHPAHPPFMSPIGETNGGGLSRYTTFTGWDGCVTWVCPLLPLRRGQLNADTTTARLSTRT